VQAPVTSRKKYPFEAKNKAKGKGVLFRKESQSYRELSRFSASMHGKLSLQLGATETGALNRRETAGKPPEMQTHGRAVRQTPGAISAPPRNLRAGTRFTRAYTHMRARTGEPAKIARKPPKPRREYHPTHPSPKMRHKRF